MRRGEGEARFEADGKTWTLRFDYNALADFEDEVRKAEPGVRLGDLMGSGVTADLTLAHTRMLFRAALQEHHPGTTLRAAGRLWVDGQEALRAAMEAASPAPASGADAPAEAPGKMTPRRSRTAGAKRH